MGINDHYSKREEMLIKMRCFNSHAKNLKEHLRLSSKFLFGLHFIDVPPLPERPLHLTCMEVTSNRHHANETLKFTVIIPGFKMLSKKICAKSYAVQVKSNKRIMLSVMYWWLLRESNF